MWQIVLVDSVHGSGAHSHSGLAEILRELMCLVAPAERMAAMAAVLDGQKYWPGADQLTRTLESAGVSIVGPERHALTIAGSIIQWARRDRQTTSIEELSIRWRLSLGELQREVLEVALLDAAGRLTPDGVVRVQEGERDQVVVHPRRIMELALRHGATALVLAHNHPSGKVSPTRRDRDATRRIVLAGTTLDVTVADHLIVSSEEVFSFRREGLL